MPTSKLSAREGQVFLPIKPAAEKLGIPYWKLLRACNVGLIPAYRLLNSRRYVKVAEVEQVLQQSMEG
ncbi:MAG: hypothetical protein J0L97_03500 [Alphaproteobacteria bacterium]|nr:hypothetical protein [Alphaproteobacteria bacterium]